MALYVRSKKYGKGQKDRFPALIEGVRGRAVFLAHILHLERSLALKSCCME